MFQFDKNGKFVREIGKDTYGFMVAAQVRVDAADNLWVVDEMTNMVMKFDPQGRVAMLLGRKAESENVPAGAGRGGGRGGFGGDESHGGSCMSIGTASVCTTIGILCSAATSASISISAWSAGAY